MEIDEMENSFEIISADSESDGNSLEILQENQTRMKCLIASGSGAFGDNAVQDSEEKIKLEISTNTKSFHDLGDLANNENTLPEAKDNNLNNDTSVCVIQEKTDNKSNSNKDKNETVVEERIVMEPRQDELIENSKTISNDLIAVSADNHLEDSNDLLCRQGNNTELKMCEEIPGATALVDNSDVNITKPSSVDCMEKVVANEAASTEEIATEQESGDKGIFSGPKAMFRSVTTMFNHAMKSAEEKKSEQTANMIVDTSRQLGDLNREVSLFDGVKSDTQFINLKERLNSILQTFITLRNKNFHNKDIKPRLSQIIQDSKQILNTLNIRADEFEVRKASDTINRIYEEIMAINNEIENNSHTIDEFNLFEKKLTNFLLSLDNVTAKGNPTLKENYVATVRKLHEILQLLNEKSNTSANAMGYSPISNSSSVDSLEIFLDVEPVESNDNEELISQIDGILKTEYSNAVTNYNKFLKDSGCLDNYVKNLESIHTKAKVLCEARCLRFTSTLQALVEEKMRNFNQEINGDFKQFQEFNKSCERKNLQKIKEEAFQVLSREQENVIKFIKDTNGQKELPDTFQAKVDKIFESMEKYKDSKDDFCREILNEIQKFIASMMKNVNEKKSVVCISSILEIYKFDTEIKKFGIVYNVNLTDELEKMKSATLTTFTNIRKTSVHNDHYYFKISQDIDAINKTLLTKNYELWKEENEKYEQYLKDCQANYKSEMFDKMTSLGYLPDSEEIDEFHKQTFPNSLLLLQGKCTNLNITLKYNDIQERLKQILEKEFEKVKENVSLRKFNQRKTALAASNQFAYAVGIDLGTTFSCVTVYKNGKFEELKNFNGLRTTPSVVYTGKDELIVGHEASIKGLLDPSNLIHGVKRIIGRTYNEPEVISYILSSVCKVKKNDEGGVSICSSSNKLFKPEEISAEILKEMKHIAEQHLKNPVNDVVVTIPAFFTEPQRSATLEACKLAGLNVLRLLNEPTAAALAYGYYFRSEESKNVLVFDFGGGTCDVSILEVNGENLKVKASHGDNYLGGLDFDQNLMKFFIKNLEKEKHIVINELNKRRILQECEKVKKILSDVETADIYLAEISNGVELNYKKITRSWFENLNRELFERALITVEKSLASAGLMKHDIDDIVLVGGSSHIPKMQHKLREYFGKSKLECKINPDEAISYGAALQAAMITGECKIDFKLHDITPFSLGKSLHLDCYKIIIPKNSKLPCRGTGKTVTVYDYQESVSSSIYQGENPVASLNSYLGVYHLCNIVVRKAGETQFDTTFEIDENGILTVTAVEVGKEHNQVKVVVDRRVN